MLYLNIIKFMKKILNLFIASMLFYSFVWAVGWGSMLYIFQNEKTLEYRKVNFPLYRAVSLDLPKVIWEKIYKYNIGDNIWARKIVYKKECDRNICKEFGSIDTGIDINQQIQLTSKDLSYLQIFEEHKNYFIKALFMCFITYFIFGLWVFSKLSWKYFKINPFIWSIFIVFIIYYFQNINYINIMWMIYFAPILILF